MRSWQVGEVRITRIVEAEPLVPMGSMFPMASPGSVEGGRSWLEPSFIDSSGNLRLSINSFLVEWRDRRIVVDTAVGKDKQRTYAVPTGGSHDYLRDLEAAGFTPDSVDTVVCTHLHWDHVGWNTSLVDGRWSPTFKNARYVVSRPEWEFWMAQRAAGAPPIFDSDVALADSFDPVVEAGLVDLVTVDHSLAPTVTLMAAGGHTPGHVAVWIESEGAAAAITGDLIHSPVQIMHPDWASGSDIDSAEAVRTRRSFLDRCARADALVIGTHFATPTAGHVVADGDSWRLVPVDDDRNDPAMAGGD